MGFTLDPLQLLRMVDGRTLLLAAALTAGSFSPILLFGRRARTLCSGCSQLAFAEFSLGVLLFFEAIRDTIGDLIPVVVGNLLLCCSMLVLVRGMHRFTGRRQIGIWLYAVSALYLTAIAYFYWIDNDLRVRVMIIGTFLCIVLASAASPLLREAPEGCRFSYRFTAVFFLSGSLMALTRACVVGATKSMNSLFTGHPMENGFYLFDLIFVIGITLSFYLLTNERALASLREANKSLAQEIEETSKTTSLLQAEVEERKRLQDELNHLVNTDDLTGILNRRGLLSVLQQEVLRAARFKHPLSVLILDLDRFKRINDQYGHAVGDQALLACVSKCRRQLRAIDIVGRLGGEEFAFILPETDIAGAEIVGEKLRAGIANEEIVCGEIKFSTTASIGIAAWTKDDESGVDTIARADRALYRAKAAGRNCVRIAL
ncbi:MAG: GGDEF domain-containing protein [Acidobacteriota bacterium]|nr:GGDEF domain-containing protein [Acidobacteriota bacterium]